MLACPLADTVFLTASNALTDTVFLTPSTAPADDGHPDVITTVYAHPAVETVPAAEFCHRRPKG